jgi:thiol-disulfide isomerase/thioredoxin
MTKIGDPPRRRVVLSAVFGALAAAAAAAVLYETAQPAGKAAGDCPADSSKLAAKLAPLAKGELAALTIASEPRRPEQFAFEREGGGGKLTLADFRGRAVVLNLWATWCAPCRAEMPALDRLEAASGDQGFEVVAVNVDTARLERRAAFLDSVGVKALTRYADPSGDAFETLRKDGKALGLPVTLLIDKEGCEIGAVEGPMKWDSAEAEALIGALKKGG